jgi:hypothetical protein
MSTTPVSAQPIFHISAIPASTIDKVRRGGPDASGRPAETATCSGGEPLRCCLQDAQPGEVAILFNYEPPLLPSPYREVGAVFAHASDSCPGPVSAGYPEAWVGRPQVLRAYDRRGWIHAARVHDGSDPAAAIAELLADPAVEQLHSRNVAYGCFMFSIRRAAVITTSE